MFLRHTLSRNALNRSIIRNSRSIPSRAQSNEQKWTTIVCGNINVHKGYNVLTTDDRTFVVTHGIDVAIVMRQVLTDDASKELFFKTIRKHLLGFIRLAVDFDGIMKNLTLAQQDILSKDMLDKLPGLVKYYSDFVKIMKVLPSNRYRDIFFDAAMQKQLPSLALEKPWYYSEIYETLTNDRQRSIFSKAVYEQFNKQQAAEISRPRLGRF